MLSVGQDLALLTYGRCYATQRPLVVHGRLQVARMGQRLEEDEVWHAHPNLLQRAQARGRALVLRLHARRVEPTLHVRIDPLDPLDLGLRGLPLPRQRHARRPVAQYSGVARSEHVAPLDGVGPAAPVLHHRTRRLGPYLAHPLGEHPGLRARDPPSHLRARGQQANGRHPAQAGLARLAPRSAQRPCPPHPGHRRRRPRRPLASASPAGARPRLRWVCTPPTCVCPAPARPLGPGPASAGG